LKPKKSSGHDGITSEFIRKAKNALSIPLSILINKTIEFGHVPKILKLAKVIPIYKNKNPELYSNYRPISLLPSISKIMEKVIHKRLYHFMNNHNLLYDGQYGFRPKFSTINAITDLTANILKSLDNKKHTVGVFLDLSKAFDTINHKTLLKKLQYYGVRGIALEWFRSYLTDRMQYVCYNGIDSHMQNITCGVPQGSVLGPLLFIIYTNDLPQALVDSKCVLFADDTTIHYSSKNILDAFNHISKDLSSLTDWFRANKLSLNINKTNYIVFTMMPNGILDYDLKIGNELIEKVDSTTFLGVKIDKNLEWYDHIQMVRNKVSSGLYALSSVKHILPYELMRQIYFTLIHPYLNYGTLLWGSAKKMHLRKLVTLQNKSVRMVTLANYNASAAPIYTTTKSMPFDNLFKSHLANLMFQHKHNQLPPAIQHLFTANTETHSHHTRQQWDPHVTRKRTKKISDTFLHKAPEYWYRIPQDIKECITINAFKNKMKIFMVNK
jgi:uncharacterized surface protein with fasciclin (FAS1) repeats